MTAVTERRAWYPALGWAQTEWLDDTGRVVAAWDGQTFEHAACRDGDPQQHPALTKDVAVEWVERYGYTIADPVNTVHSEVTP